MKMNFIINCVFLTCFLLYAYNEVLSQELEGNPADLPNQGICGNKVIINGPYNLKTLRNCSIIDGVLKILLFDKNFDDKDYNMSFPELREVTEYVLVYRVYGLKTLGQLFPNLAVIRGRKLLVNYALTIYESKNFQEIGLRSLTKIMRGFVRIQNNPQMCFDTTIDWEKITGSKDGHVFLGNGPPSCPGRDACRGCDEQTCWNSRHCQRLPSPKCHKECLDTCTPLGGKCYRCRHFMNDNICVKECPPDKYEFLPTSHCLSRSKCRRMYNGRGWIWGRQCVNSCPKGFLPTRDATTREVTCVACSRLPCKKECQGSEINAIAHAQLYKECTHINGSLQIRITEEFGTGLMKELEDSLGDIEVIRGYLKVYRSLSITSLDFFKNLTKIQGDVLEFDRYSLLAYENSNLQSLWDWNKKKKFTLVKGTMYYQLNPKLCLKEIDKLRNLTNSIVNAYDVSPESNGVKFVCDYIPLQAKSIVVDARYVTITWERFFLSNPGRPVTGYQLYYLEDPEEDVSFYFGRDSCLTRVWKSIIIPEVPNTTTKWMTTNITDLTHSTKYAFYVETYYEMADTNTVDTSSNNAQSSIQFFTTKSQPPAPPNGVKAMSYTTDSITVYWLKDTEYRGNITRYILELHIQSDDKHQLDSRNYCNNPLKLYPSALNKSIAQTQEDLAPQDVCKCKKIKRVWDKVLKTETEKLFMLMDENDLESEMLPELLEYQTIEEDDTKGNHTKKRRHAGTFTIPEDFHQPMTRPVILNVTAHDKFNYFSTEFSSQHENFTITSLKHFTKYMIHLAACIGPLYTDCGAVAITIERTLKQEQADFIKSIKIEVLNDTAALVRWPEPDVVNGVILSYTIEYKLLDIENFQIVHICLTRLQHESNHYKYVLTDLLPGTYLLRIKATSLAGDGQYTSHVKFEVQVQKSRLWIILFILCVATFVMLSCIGYYLQKSSECYNDEERLVLPDNELAVGYSVNANGVEIFSN